MVIVYVTTNMLASVLIMQCRQNGEKKKTSRYTNLDMLTDSSMMVNLSVSLFSHTI